MNLLRRKFSKEETQRLALVAIIVVAVLAGFWQFALKPLGNKKKQLDKEIQAVRAEFQRNDGLVAGGAKVEALYNETRDRVQAILKESVPPQENAMAWANDLFMEQSVALGRVLDIQSVNEGGVDRLSGGRSSAVPLFEDYLIQIESAGGYHDFGRFLAKLEGKSPFMRVDSFSLRREAKGSGKMAITLACAFPRFTEEGFAPGERPDAEVPRVQPPKTEKETKRNEGE